VATGSNSTPRRVVSSSAPPGKRVTWGPREEADATQLLGFRDMQEASIWISVKRQAGVVPLRIEMLPWHTIADLKRAIAKLGGVPKVDQRLFARSCLLDDEQTLEECGLQRRPEVQLVPCLDHKPTAGVSAIPARRGYNMVPGNSTWTPSRAAKITPRDLHEFWGPGDSAVGWRLKSPPASDLPELSPYSARAYASRQLCLPAGAPNLTKFVAGR